MPADVLALFDLDNTLLQHDSDEQWVAFLIEEGELDGETFKRASDLLASRYRRGEADTLEYTEFYLSTLCDRPLGELQALHDRFMDERIRPGRRQTRRGTRRTRTPQGMAADRAHMRMTTPTLTAFAAPMADRG